MVNYVCHRTDRLTEAEGSAILVRRGIDHKPVTVQDLKHLEATAIQDTLASKPVKILEVCTSTSRSPDCYRIFCLP